MSYQPGDILFDKYRVERLLGRGAFAEVYLVMHQRLKAWRAIKVLRRDAPGLGSSSFGDFNARFQLEAQLGARLDNAHVIRVYELEDDGQQLGLVMEYAAGGSLASWLQRARQHAQSPAVTWCVQMGLELAEGLAALHKLDAVHRDLKPSNVLFDKDGHAKVADLGLAQTPGGPSMRSQLSQALAHPGTPGYMSPEQESSFGYLKPASDVYALGLVLFEALTLRSYHNLRPGTRLRSQRPESPEWLEVLLARMLAENPKERPWDGEECAALLRDGADEKTKRQAEERAKQEAEQRTLQEAEAAARKKAEAEAKARSEAEEKARQAAEAKAQQEAAARVRHEAEERARRELVLELAPGVKMEFVRVPAGEFLMGSDKKKDPKAEDDELPQHKVQLSEYLIGKYPVTVAQFAAFVRASGYQTQAEKAGYGWHWTGKWEQLQGASWQHPHGLKSGVENKQEHPVTQVSWNDGQAFCQWASQASGSIIRLPTEAEWEKAGRGADGRLYPWGDQALDEQHANFGMNIRDTTPVGRYSPQGDSPYGCVELAGNVWEWTADWYDEKYYQQSPSKDPPGPASGKYRVLRGGSWNFN